ncbi:MAG TPA: hypothetical protein VF060_33515 [Trebonia sp.]
MKLLPHRRNLVVFSSAVAPADSHVDLQCKRPARTGRIRRFIRIGMLLTVIAVLRPRSRSVLAGIVLTILGVVERQGAGGVLIIPGFIFLWYALLIPADTDADRQMRSQLKREMATYSTPAQRYDLEATLERYPDGITYEMRNILASQAVASDNNRIPGAGPQ